MQGSATAATVLCKAKEVDRATPEYLGKALATAMAEDNQVNGKDVLFVVKKGILQGTALKSRAANFGMLLVVGRVNGYLEHPRKAKKLLNAAAAPC